MKITIELSDAQVRGMREYLKEVGDIEKPNREDIKREVDGIVQGYLSAPQSALTDYIKQAEQE